MPDVIAVFIWWVLLQAMGWVSLPLLFRVLRWLPDRGYSVAKPAGLLLGNYVLWLLGGLGWLRNTEGGILVAFGLVLAFGVWVYRRWDDGPRLLDWVREHKWWVIAYEAVFVVALVGWVIYRSYNPDLTTTEKPAEFALMNAIRRSAEFPPPDPWLSGFSISYYYFGYVMMSTLTKLSGVASGVAFSLSCAVWFALTAAGAFGVVANLVAASKSATRLAIVSAGLLGAVFVPVLSNFEAPLDVAHTNGLGSAEFWRWLDIQEINSPPTPLAPGETRWPFCDQCSHPRGYWWFWRASRVLHDYPVGSLRANPAEYEEVIDEFPMFSFLLGDMHPHVLALPFALMSLALAFNVFQLGRQVTGRGWREWFWKPAPIGLVYPVCLGALSFLNTWDYPTQLLVVVAAWTLGRWLHAARLKATDDAAEAPQSTPGVWSDALTVLMACGAAGVIAYLPFYIGFRSQAGGLLPNIFYPTRWPQFFVMFGPFLLIGGAFILTLLLRVVSRRRLSLASALIGSVMGGAGLVVVAAVLTTAATAAVLLVSSGIRAKLEGWSQGLDLTQAVITRLGEFSVPLLLGVWMMAIILIIRATRAVRTLLPGRPQADDESAAPFVLILLLVGALLTFGVEFVYLLDFFGTRINSVFKLYYQAWGLWGVASAYAVYYLWQSHERLRQPVARLAFGAVLAAGIFFGMWYPLLGMATGTVDRGAVKAITPTLDARAPTLQVYAPDEAAAAEWLAQNVKGLPVLLEAKGGSFDAWTSRVSAWSGLPSVLGWEGHEGQWRGTYDDTAPRVSDIDRLYTVTDLTAVLALMHKYDISFVYVGPNEIRKYPPAGLAKFGSIMDVVFQQGDSTVYRRRDAPANEVAVIP